MPPFRATLRETVSDVQDIETTRTGKPMFILDLGDGEGTWLRCCAVDRHARQQDLVNGREVAIYFGYGRGSLGSASGAVYVMDNAVIVPTGKTLQHILKVMQVEL